MLPEMLHKVRYTYSAGLEFVEEKSLAIIVQITLIHNNVISYQNNACRGCHSNRTLAVGTCMRCQALGYSDLSERGK